MKGRRIVFTRKPGDKSSPFPSDGQRLATPDQVPLQATQSSRASGGASEGMSVIGNDLSIEGQSITIRCKGALQVNGNIQADLHSRRLVVGQEAVISGAIAANDVDVLGRVHGAIYGSHVRLHQSAHVDGDIHSEHLEIEKGATFDGRSRKVRDQSEIAPKLEAEPQAGRAQSAPQATVYPSIVTPPRVAQN
jgi:cytoskeletal protein CcmA (bactofilin family)